MSMDYEKPTRQWGSEEETKIRGLNYSEHIKPWIRSVNDYLISG